jgi:acetyl-CoA carboxylase biotin carboxyl carrier protein
MGDPSASAKSKEGEGPGRPAETQSSFNMSELRELADLVDEHGFTDFEFENENIRVRLSKMVAPAPSPAPVPTPVQQSTAGQGVLPSAEPAGPPLADEGLHNITSPIVGTFYRAPGPDKEPYVKEGSIVSPDSVVCIVEAMKLMNEIQAEVAGEVVRIFVENGQAVEFGQPLFAIRK